MVNEKVGDSRWFPTTRSKLDFISSELSVNRATINGGNYPTNDLMNEQTCMLSGCNQEKKSQNQAKKLWIGPVSLY